VAAGGGDEVVGVDIAELTGRVAAGDEGAGDGLARWDAGDVDLLIGRGKCAQNIEATCLLFRVRSPAPEPTVAGAAT
jgi:hypothetical protein